MRAGRGACLVVFSLVAITGTAAADEVRRQARQLQTASDYRVRLSAALNLSGADDARAIAALSFALTRDRDSTVRRVAAASLGRSLSATTPARVRGRALSALERAAARDADARVRAASRRALAAARAAAPPARARARGRSTVYIKIGAPNDLTRGVSHDIARRLHETVHRTVRKHAPHYATSADRPEPTRAELQRNGARGFHVASTISRVSVERRGRYAEVACSVSVMVSPWSGSDGDERLVAGSAASATGNGRVLGSASGRGVSHATRECLLTVAEEVTARQVIPFLQRVASR